jgi:hypothetical protein
VPKRFVVNELIARKEQAVEVPGAEKPLRKKKNEGAADDERSANDPAKKELEETKEAVVKRQKVSDRKYLWRELNKELYFTGWTQSASEQVAEEALNARKVVKLQLTKG